MSDRPTVATVKELARQLDRAVGYQKPPVTYQWQPGQSGNPNGRPKTKSLAETFRELAARPLNCDGKQIADSSLQLVVKKMFEKALNNSDTDAARLILSMAREFLPRDPELFAGLPEPATPQDEIGDPAKN